MKENKINICKKILKDADNILNEFTDATEFKFPADTSHFDFDSNFNISSAGSQSQSHQPIYFSTWHISSTWSQSQSHQPKVLPMCLLTIPLALHLTICFYANQLIYKVRRKKVQGRKTKSQKRMPKNILFFHLVKNHAAEGELPTFPLVIER